MRRDSLSDDIMYFQELENTSISKCRWLEISSRQIILKALEYSKYKWAT